jgi:hypothetical protein
VQSLLGITGLLGALLLTTALGVRFPCLRMVLLVAFFVRALAALVHAYIIPLPDGFGDAVTFEIMALNYAAHGFAAVFTQFPGYGGGLGYAWLMGLIYSITGRSSLLIQALNVMASIGSVYLAYRLAKAIWDESAAIKTAWAVALFPTLIMYSAVTLREAFIVFFVLYASLNIVLWSQSGSLRSLFLAFMSFVFAGFFHGGILLGSLILVAILVGISLREVPGLLLKGRFKGSTLFFFAAGSASILPYFLGIYVIPYIGDITRATSVDAFISHANVAQQGGASFPHWLSPQDPLHYILLLPVRFVYFLGAPFPWDIRSAQHLIGLFDGLLYLTIVWLIMHNLPSIWANRSARLLLIILIPLIVIYTVGTGNFGTGIRHRAKFIAVLVVLAAPFIPRLRLGIFSKYSK